MRWADLRGLWISFLLDGELSGLFLSVREGIVLAGFVGAGSWEWFLFWRGGVFLALFSPLSLLFKF